MTFSLIRQEAGLISVDKGMTLRDYFAAKAMHGMLANKVDTIFHKDIYNETARVAFLFADAMLAARDEA